MFLVEELKQDVLFGPKDHVTVVKFCSRVLLLTDQFSWQKCVCVNTDDTHEKWMRVYRSP